MSSSPSTAKPSASHLLFDFTVPLPPFADFLLDASSPEEAGAEFANPAAFLALLDAFPGPAFPVSRCDAPDGVLGREASGVGTGVASVLVVSSIADSLSFCEKAGFLRPGTGGGRSTASSPSAEAVLDGGVSSTGPSLSASLCRLVLPVSSLRTSASKVWSKSRQSSFVRCCFFSSVPYCFVKSAFAALRRLSTQDR